ncbi:hypothetical protein [Candidatus Parabeggiatoa sp. HSG14]|uniref:hypothetical protein n=1 Tax=Candidatus Parabeggiatoa sp. HSG14 TaxID=3055593 RepID=UPI0025A8D9E1|nr:hypothetical protein [Thiotrichales bacterium HSG14]
MAENSSKIFEEELPLVNTHSVKQDESLSSLNLAPKYQKLLKRIGSSSLNIPETINGIMSLEPEIFKSTKGVGVAYVEILEDLQQELTSRFNLNEIVPNKAGFQSLKFFEEIPYIGKFYLEILKEQDFLSVNETNINDKREAYENIIQVRLSNLYLNYACLDKKEINIVRKLERQCQKEISIQTFLSVNRNDFGGNIYNNSSHLRERIKNELDQKSYNEIIDIRKRGLFVSKEVKYFDMALIDEILIEDIDNYLWSFDEQLMDIVLSRWGYNKNYESLEKVGKRHKKSMERIRQLVSTANVCLQLNLRIHPEVLLANIRENKASDLTILFPKLVQCFEKTDLLYRLLEICCGIKKYSIQQEIAPKFNPNVLSDFFSNTPSPVSYELVLKELMSSYNKTQSETIIRKLIELKKIQVSEEGIVPKNMDRKSATAHVLTYHPAGLPWKDIARIINAKSYSSFSQYFEEHLEKMPQLVYLYGKGVYRHTKFLDLSQIDIEGVIIDILFYFDEQGINNIHLHDYFDQKKPNIDYYDLRYIVKIYGKEHGLYFTGSSNIDNVSLESNNESRITQKDVIVKILQSTSSAMTAQEIAKQIKSKRVSLARLYISYLQEEGRVVRVDEMMYTTPKNAFQDIDKTTIMQIISDIMLSSNRIVEADIFRETVNQQLNLSYSKYFYASLIKTQSPDWHYKQNLFSTTPIPYKNLTDIYNSQCQLSLSNKENISRIRKILYLTDSLAQKTMYVWRSKIEE